MKFQFKGVPGRLRKSGDSWIVVWGHYKFPIEEASPPLRAVLDKKLETRQMTIRDFIKENKTEIDAAIRRVCPNCRIDDAERRMWIRNDEGLYRWARSAGVRI